MKIQFSILLLWVLVLSSRVASAQITFQKKFDSGVTSDESHSVQQTNDGGYIFAGHIGQYGGLIKTDKNGTILWKKGYSGNTVRYRALCQQTFDGGYIITGNGNAPGYSLLKTDSAGVLQWAKNYGGTSSDEPYAVRQTSDGGYIMTGHTYSFGPGPRAAYVVRTDSMGDTLWTRTYGGPSYELAKDIKQTADGGFIFTGATASFGVMGGYEDVWLVKLDTNGDVIWSKTYGGWSADRGYSVQQTTDGGYIVVGETFSFSPCCSCWTLNDPCPEVYLIKTDSVGNIQWNRTFGNATLYTADHGAGVQQTFDGGYIIAGRTGIVPTGNNIRYDIYMIKTNVSGDLTWSKKHGGIYNEQYYDSRFDIQQTADSGYITIGTTESFGQQAEYDIYLVKTDQYGNSGCNEDTVNTIVGNPATVVGSGALMYKPATVVTTPATTAYIPAIIDSTLCYNCFVVLVSKTDVACNGGSNGSIDITLPAGTPPFTYLWSTGDTTEDVTGLSAGVYDVTIIDSTGCNPKETIIITQPPPLGSSFASTNVSCSGGSNGAINLTPMGGTPPYTYLWSTGSTTQDISGLTAGGYTVTVTDANGCQRTDNVTITQPQPNAVTGTTTPSTDCDSTGTINITASGGTPPYTYSWSNGAATEDLDSVGAGLYYVIAADSNGCFGIASFTVNEIPSFTLTVSTSSATCGNADGSASVTVSGGAAPYTYSWSTGDTLSLTDSLSAGLYTVTVTDSTGCSETADAAINNVAGPAITGTSVANVACSGQCNGSASLTASGGTAPYSYLWNDSSGQNTPGATGLCNGIYTVSVTDSNGCMAVSSVTINEPFPLSAGIIVFSDVVCAGSNNGTATVLATGGTTPYIYLWSNGSATSSATGLPADTSFVLVTDDNGCTDMDSVALSEPSALTAAVSVNDVRCSGGNDGSATVTATGGIPPYSYLWSNGQITQIASGFSAGTYSNTVTDSNGCKEIDTVIISQPDLLTISISGTPDISNSGIGMAWVTVAGGTISYTYQWNDPFVQTSDTATGLFTGSYTVNVTDNNGCKNSASIVVGNASGINENDFSASIQIYPNPTAGAFTLYVPFMDANETGYVSVLNILGETVYRNLLIKPETIIPVTASAGVYFVCVQANRGVFYRKLAKN